MCPVAAAFPVQGNRQSTLAIGIDATGLHIRALLEKRGHWRVTENLGGLTDRTDATIQQIDEHGNQQGRQQRRHSGHDQQFFSPAADGVFRGPGR